MVFSLTGMIHFCPLNNEMNRVFERNPERRNVKQHTETKLKTLRKLMEMGDID